MVMPNLSTHVYIFLAVLAALLALFVGAFWVRGHLLGRRLDRLAKGITELPKSQRITQDLFVGDELLSHLWQEFEKTLHEQKQLDVTTGEMRVVAQRPTTAAEAFFNTQSVVDNRLGTEFFKHLPGIFTGIGIIGTFYGLILGLRGFKVSEKAEEARLSLNTLLGSVGEAFIVSASAILIAMVVTFIEKVIVARLYRKVEVLNQAIDSRLRAGAGEEYLARLVQASEESATQTKQLKDSLVDDLKQVLAELTERQINAMQAGYSGLGQSIGRHIESSLQRPLEDIAKAAGGLREDQGGAVTQLLTDVLAGFGQRMEELFGGQVAGINHLQQQTMDALQAAVSSLQKMAGEMQDSGTRATDAMSERLAQAMTNMEARQEALNRRMGEFLDQLRQITRDSEAETQNRLNDALASVTSKMTEMIVALQQQGAAAAASAAERESLLSRQASASMTQLGGQVEGVVHAIAAATTEMANAVSAMRQTTRDSETETQSRLNDALDGVTSKMADMMGALQQQGAAAATSAAEREDVLARQASASISQLGGHVESVVNAIAEATGEMANAVSAMRQVTSESVTKMNAGAETLYIASTDFAKAGQAVSGTLNQATVLSGNLTESAGAVQASTRSLESAVNDYRAVRETLARMLEELKGAVQAAKTEASFTGRALGDITAAAEKLNVAQKEADAYLSKVNDVIAGAHAAFTEGMQKSLAQAHNDSQKHINAAIGALSSSIEELGDVLATVPVAA